MEKIVRHPEYAGEFYPLQPDKLEEEIRDFFSQASEPADPESVRALLAPHAGYLYSGRTAAAAFKNLSGRSAGTVVLIGNSHQKSFSGAAFDDSDLWLTPLGEVEVDKKLAARIKAESDLFFFDRSIHQGDHVLEVELPFLQTALKEGFKILPIVFGNTGVGTEELAEALSKHLGENDLVVISSDMSHYPSYEDANQIDSSTLEIISAGDIKKLEEHEREILGAQIPKEDTILCGIDAVKKLMRLAAIKNWQSEIIDYANSGDSEQGDKKAVVGYGALAFFSADLLNFSQKEELLRIARKSVEYFVKTGAQLKIKVVDERLERKEGVFVTLYKEGALRGCIGQVTASKSPLWENVREMAIAAASEDGRFLPVTKAELASLHYEISVLSPAREISDWQEIRLGKDGVIITQGKNKGVFLPQVALETGWSLEEFLDNLCQEKASLPRGCYKNDSKVRIEVFTVQAFSEDDI